MQCDTSRTVLTVYETVVCVHSNEKVWVQMCGKLTIRPCLYLDALPTNTQNRHMRDRRGEVTVKTARNITKAISFAALLVTALASLSRPARSQEAAARYSKMPAVDQHLMTDRRTEIAMARSAAPHRFQPMPTSSSSAPLAPKPSPTARSAS